MDPLEYDEFIFAICEHLQECREKRYVSAEDYKELVRLVSQLKYNIDQILEEAHE